MSELFSLWTAQTLQVKQPPTNSENHVWSRLQKNFQKLKLNYLICGSFCNHCGKTTVLLDSAWWEKPNIQADNTWASSQKKQAKTNEAAKLKLNNRIGN